MNTANNRILLKMLDRLLNSLMNGPSLNCRPHSSRQRIDWTQLDRLEDRSPAECLLGLLSEKRSVTVTARVPAPAKVAPGGPIGIAGMPDDDRIDPAERAWNDQRTVLNKLRTIVEDSKTYESDTGVHVLNVGYPLLSLPPGALGPRARSATRRIIAPIAFLPVAVTVKAGVVPSIEIECRGSDLDLVVPNTALMAWLEQQTGASTPDLFADEKGDDPWREISELVAHVAKVLGLAVPDGITPSAGAESENIAKVPGLRACPRTESDDAGAMIVPSAVLGLFPLTNQGLLRDMQAMVAGENVTGPIESFIRVDATLESPSQAHHADNDAKRPKSKRHFGDERLISGADPCQVRSVKLARTCNGLVIHGPPGTGKSQTITNIIGDHLARGERVLVVCDKRTALDVVFTRLEAIGLGNLCAVVHDPQRDQRDLYKSIRDQLDALPDVTSNSRAASRVEKADAELQGLHAELTEYHDALSSRSNGDGFSFHDLVGEWFAIPAETGAGFDDAMLAEISVADLEGHAREAREILERGHAASYSTNKWVQAAGMNVRDFLATPMDRIRQSLAICSKVAEAADATGDDAIPLLTPTVPLKEQAALRADLAEKLMTALSKAPPAPRARWAKQDAAAVAMARQKLAESKAIIEAFQRQSLDAELALVVRDNLPALFKINADLASLAAYLSIADKWYAFLKMSVKKAATAALTPYGLTLSKANGERLHAFLAALRARIILSELHNTVLAEPTGQKLLPDDELFRSLTAHTALLELLTLLHGDKRNHPLISLVTATLVDAEAAQKTIHGLKKSSARCDAIERLCTVATETRLFNPEWLGRIQRKLCEGAVAGPAFSLFAKELPSLENVLRVREGLAALSAQLSMAVGLVVTKGIDAERGVPILRRAALANAITDRLRNETQLHGMDGQRIKTNFDRYRQLEAQKLGTVRDAVLHHWISRQKDRLLAGTGSRMNSLGAEVRRRLMLRGQRALRLRQVIALGQQTEGGDPLFDLRPVWMASPETVAQLFPRSAVFDVVVFDEASQCRLEEAIPVLTRGRRLTVAGDPKQLPPTRFFESAIAASEEVDVETGQELFEQQQSEVEDLLTAALNLDIQESYLDVHYRSRNADLIGFSNEQFYEARLQPIPGHPSNRTRYSPITLYQVNGVYEKRENPAEADAVCSIVRDLLKRGEPPTIGIACFNISQRDLIVEHLDALAEKDRDFGRRLDAARRRKGYGASAHLFVKNLENVQGDERDHIIISTTYGPDAKGKFYQRFGPLGRVGGGRRLNVLVTRAREELHLVTSIPPSVYRHAEPVPTGQTPGGGWLLYAFLRYAEVLAEAYKNAHESAEEVQRTGEPVALQWKTHTPSKLAEAFAEHMARQHRTGSAVYWGNDGFCVDLALQHPKYAEDVTIGILCDATRFNLADDPVEWDIFRTGILEGQGWTLHRVWSPHFFRDVQGHVQRIRRDVDLFLTKERARDALPVEQL